MREPRELDLSIGIDHRNGGVGDAEVETDAARHARSV
jgi:hypothetical protein